MQKNTTDHLFPRHVSSVTLQMNPEEVADLNKALNRALNTWPEAPKSIWALSAKCEEFLTKNPQYAATAKP